MRGWGWGGVEGGEGWWVKVKEKQVGGWQHLQPCLLPPPLGRLPLLQLLPTCGEHEDASTAADLLGCTDIGSGAGFS